MEQDKQLVSYFEGLARAASARGGARFSRFLDPAQREMARQAAARQMVEAAFFGGYEAAERTVAAFYFQGSPPRADKWPLACLQAGWSRHAPAPAHRDLLGAQMGLGLERDCFGDILVGSQAAYLFVSREVAAFVQDNLREAGRTPLSLRLVEGPPEDLPQPQGQVVRVTVGSMRLDALVAAVWKLSRARAQSLIAGQRVKLNHLPCLRGDARVAQGDMISVRELGRAWVLRDEGLTRKGRQGVVLFLYGNN